MAILAIIFITFGPLIAGIMGLSFVSCALSWKVVLKVVSKDHAGLGSLRKAEPHNSFARSDYNSCPS
ncbi:hypothetical protein MUK42_35726 [Musa troglodytarum]|uniref:Uncharacterized protein n=1 Tax=Musa troglodytarum TaxID=320322 RepID=A0A9E7HW85_9LILI|nr:hypothetical protein MUK42_35726 [Musa troglodytarum]